MLADSLRRIAKQKETYTETFQYTGVVQTWVVPANVYSVDLECWGARGGTATNGGLGGYAKGTPAVTPGETLRNYVGGYNDGAGGGWNGGAVSDGFNGGASGGGASDVRLGGTALSNRKIVAAGGGGRGLEINGSSVRGGHGGADIGENGQGIAGGVGTGGTQSAGGGDGTLYDQGSEPGALGVGGKGCTYSGYDAFSTYITALGGGGGGGYYGGGGGNAYVDTNGSYLFGGGGGSNYVGGVTSPTSTRGVRTGHGLIVITYEA